VSVPPDSVYAPPTASALPAVTVLPLWLTFSAAGSVMGVLKNRSQLLTSSVAVPELTLMAAPALTFSVTTGPPSVL
jgi:hypothetical protein